MRYKEYIEQLPGCVFPDPGAMDNKVLAISIPLFHSEYDRSDIVTEFDENNFLNIHCRGAIWAAAAMLTNTDLAENGVGVYFHIEDAIWDMAYEFFQGFGVPEKVMRKITIPEAPPVEDEWTFEGPGVQWGKKYMCLIDPEISPEIYMLVDSDTFFCTSGEKIPLYANLTTKRMRECLGTMYASIYGMPYRGALESTCTAAGFTYKEAYDDYAQDVDAHRRMGIPAEKVERVNHPDTIVSQYSCLNNIVTIPAKRTEVVEGLKGMMRIAREDEAMIASYGTDDLILQLKDIIQIEQFNKEIDYLNATARGTLPKHYIAHFRKTEELESYFKVLFEDISRNLPLDQIHQYQSIGWTDFADALSQTVSDKITQHDYGFLYNLFINSLLLKQQRPLKVLEIGVSLFGEGSLKAMQMVDAFQEIAAIDTLPYEGRISRTTTFYQADAYDLNLIQMLAERHGEFDLIIDDGSHAIQNQEFVLTHYYQLLAPGGMIVVEDVHDAAFFKRMCEIGECFGIDGWGNVPATLTDHHRERLLIRSR